MKQFKNGQRVVVKRGADGIELPNGAHGTVVRLRRCDDGAWVSLYNRLSGDLEALHPFAVDDQRATHILAYPEDCESA